MPSLYQYTMVNLPDVDVDSQSSGDDAIDGSVIERNDESHGTEMPAWHSLSAAEIYMHMRQAKA